MENGYDWYISIMKKVTADTIMVDGKEYINPNDLRMIISASLEGYEAQEALMTQYRELRTNYGTQDDLKEYDRESISEYEYLQEEKVDEILESWE
tara:strand:- start:1235 stop:1519 length:285 start_codon:yes stop_codon:yes gene_type:complete